MCTPRVEKAGVAQDCKWMGHTVTRKKRKVEHFPRQYITTGHPLTSAFTLYVSVQKEFASGTRGIEPRTSRGTSANILLNVVVAISGSMGVA